MARELGVTTTEHSYDDLWLSSEALKCNVENDFAVQQIKDLYEMDFAKLTALLERFKSIDKDGSGTLSQSEFESVLGVQQGSDDARADESCESLFSFFDTDGSGGISYREFIQGVALISGRCSTQSQAKLAFLVLDMEGKGTVRADKLRQALSKTVPKRIWSSWNLPDADVELSFEEFSKVLDKMPIFRDVAADFVRSRVQMEGNQDVITKP